MNETNPSGYSAEMPYIYAYFRQQHPAMMHWQLLLQGYVVPSGIQHLPHLELGFGQGLGLSLSAVSRQHEHYVGVDFMPEHCAGVDALCDGIADHLTLYPTDFQTFLDQNATRFQSISLHGVWSWVNPDIRQQLLTIVDRFLAKGGIVYLSHNTLPGRAPVLPLQRLLYLTGNRVHADEMTSLSTAFATLAQALPQSRYAQEHPSLATWWEEVSQSHPAYLTHEYMSSAWFPMLFADTAGLLAQAELSYLCSADTIESLSDLHLTSDQQTWLAQFEDRNLRESYSDLLRNTGFRRDIWGKGIHSLSHAEQRAMIMNTPLTLIQPVGALSLNLTGELGEFELPTEIYLLVLACFDQDAVMTGIQWLHKIHAQITDSLTTEQFIEMLTVLTAIGYLHPAQSHEAVAKAIEPCRLLNERLCQRAWSSSAIHYLASPVAGCGIQVSPWQQLCLLARSATHTEDIEVWLDWLMQQPQARAFGLFEQMASLTQVTTQFSLQRLPLLKQLAIVF